MKFNTTLKLKQLLLLPAVALTALGLSAPTAKAAHINIDDSDLNTITITAGDFEGGFSVNGVPLSPDVPLTLPDGAYSFTGSWFDLGLSGGTTIDLSFAFLIDPFAVTSGMLGEASSEESMGTITGSFGGFTGSTYFTVEGSTYNQLGGSQSGLIPFLSFEFIPENGSSVPDAGSTLALLGASIAGLSLFRRKA